MNYPSTSLPYLIIVIIIIIIIIIINNNSDDSDIDLLVDNPRGGPSCFQVELDVGNVGF